jgi:hypothetical protein
LPYLLRLIRKEEKTVKKDDLLTISNAFVAFSVVSVVFATWSFMVGDFWLASTQWLLVATVTGLWSIWAKLHERN